jgi:transposase
MALTAGVEVPPRDREVLASWVRSTSIRAGLAQRARIVLLAGDGIGTNKIARRTGASKPTVILWKKRYPAEGTGGLEDRPRPGKPRVTDDVAIVLATLEPPPKRLGVTHWSSRLLAAELGVSNVKVADVWREWGLTPWRAESFKFSTGPALEAKIRDVTGLYLNPPDKAVVLCVDENPQAQALEAATGQVTGACFPRHRHEEFLTFLKQAAKAYLRVPHVGVAAASP